MNAHFVRSLQAGVLTAAILLMGAAALAQANYAFAAPAGWTNLRTGSSSKWMNPTGTEFVILHPTTFNGDLSALVTAELKQQRAAHPTLQLWTNKSYQICGRHSARYLIWTAPSKAQGKTLVWEQVIALWGDDAYVVSYQRPETFPPSNVARSSIVSICGVGSAPEHPGGVPVQTTAPAAQSAASPAATATAAPAPSSYP
jgi:hypothetical protein